MNATHKRIIEAIKTEIVRVRGAGQQEEFKLVDVRLLIDRFDDRQVSPDCGNRKKWSWILSTPVIRLKHFLKERKTAT
jgi:hypothetical protein